MCLKMCRQGVRLVVLRMNDVTCEQLLHQCYRLLQVGLVDVYFVGKDIYQTSTGKF
jgi:hypothetical protein